MKKFFRKLFRKEKKIELRDYEKIQLLIIDEYAELLHEALGISNERLEELRLYIISALSKHDGLPIPTLKEVVDKCKHTNEVCFVSQEFAILMIKNSLDRDRDNMLKQFFRDAD